MESVPQLDEDRLRRLAALGDPLACDACTGRAFARWEPGTSNAERGRRLRSSTSPPVESCTVCEGLLARVPRFLELCLDAARDVEYRTFLVGSVVYRSLRAREADAYQRLCEAEPDLAATPSERGGAPPWPLGEWLKNELNREIGRGLEAATGKKVDFDKPELTFRVDTRLDHVDLQIADVFVRGRYRKHSRTLPQTRWPCRACNGIGCRQCDRTGKTYESSVEEFVAGPLVAESGADGEAFHGMGREDIDAKALGTGRPFVLELKRPKRRRFDLAFVPQAVVEASQGQVEVLDVAWTDAQAAARYKAADPAKTYRARCKAQAPVDREKLLRIIPSLAGATLHQRTPQRVAHRRSDLVRERRILDLRLLDASGDRFELEIRADSGTYIKEFVSGDEGRTQPNLSEALGTPVRVEELDIIDVDWKE